VITPAVASRTSQILVGLTFALTLGDVAFAARVTNGPANTFAGSLLIAALATGYAVLDSLIAQENGHLAFSVTDDGKGFDTDTNRYGTGLQGMADRLDAVGGSLDVTSRPGSGTMVSGRIPVAISTNEAARS